MRFRPLVMCNPHLESATTGAGPTGLDHDEMADRISMSRLDDEVLESSAPCAEQSGVSAQKRGSRPRAFTQRPEGRHSVA